MICSFGMMALSLGAMSAHRLMTKKNKFLWNSFCCRGRNTRLEKELTYDIAFTSIPSQYYDYGSIYHSPWTGGLDKFDV